MSSFRNHRIIVASLFLPTTVVTGDSHSQPSTPSNPVNPGNAIPEDTSSHSVNAISIPAIAARLAAAKGPLKSALSSGKKHVGIGAHGGGGPVVKGGIGGAHVHSNAHTRSSSASGQILSIVEDLKDKSRQVPPTRTTANETANPFTKLARFADDGDADKESKDDSPTNTKPVLDTLLSPTSPVSPRKHQTTRHGRDGQQTRVQRRKSRSKSRRPSVAPTSPSVPTSGSLYGEDDLPSKEHWHFESSSSCNGGLRNAIDSVSERLRKKIWVGTLGCPTDGFGEDLRKEVDERLKSQRESVAVWIPDDEFQSCYDEFCHQVLWPCLHYAVPDAPKTKMFYESASYSQYASVNRRFAEKIASVYEEGDVIFINDYHLMLVPRMLRALLGGQVNPTFAFGSGIGTPNPASNPSPSPAIGFFMHVAFPSSEIFRCLSVRRDLLLGVLGADFVGFQTANYARHFRQTVSRILAFEALPKGIQLPEGVDGGVSGGADVKDGESREGKEGGLAGGNGNGGEKKDERVRELADQGRFVDVASVPMGIDVVQLKEKMEEPEVDEWVQVLKQRYAGMKLLVGRDKLDEIQGVRHKIQAFEAFLDKFPEWQGKVVLIQVALQTTESNELAGGVADVVSRINSRFSTLTYQPVVFLHTQDLTFSQYLALLTVGDAFIVTSLREGMALRTHEWVECQKGRFGTLILSEFTGSYSYSGFRSCIAINPWDTRGTASAIHQALTMSPSEAQSRWEDLHNHVTTQTAQSFVTTFLNRTLRSHVAHLASLSQSATDPSSVPVLDLPRLLPRYKHSAKRLILIDFEGTLWQRDLTSSGYHRTLRGENEWSESDADWPKESVEVLKALSEDKRNEVWVLSGLPRAGVLGKIAKVVPKVGIVAENGCFIRTRPTRGAEAMWISMVSQYNLAWKAACLEILNYFTERTPNSFVEEREASVVWRFWSGDTLEELAGGDANQDRQWARRQAAEAQNHIFDSLGERFGLRIIPGRNSFLVLPNNISRSTAISAITHPGGPARSPYIGRAAWMSGETVTDELNASSPTSPGGRGYGSYGGGYGGNAGYGGGGYNNGGYGGSYTTPSAGDSSTQETDFILAISSDERLLRRLNEDDGAETVSTSGKGTDARWRVGFEDLGGMLKVLGGVGA